MSLLAHATFAAPGFDAERRNLDRQNQHEAREANRIQAEIGCSRTEALRLARIDSNVTAYYTDRANGAHAAKAP